MNAVHNNRRKYTFHGTQAIVTLHFSNKEHSIELPTISHALTSYTLKIITVL